MNTTTTRLVCALLTSIGLLIAAGEQRAYAQRGGTPKTTSRIEYHDGYVMAGSTNVYFIWYGCWDCALPGSDPNAQYLMELVTASLGGSPYLQTLRAYPMLNGDGPSGGLTYSGEISVGYARGSTLFDTDVKTILHDAIYNSLLPLDGRGIYLIVPSSDVQVDGMTAGRCQYHNYLDIVGAQVMYAVIPNAQRAPTICAPQFVAPDGSLLPTPNNDLAADAMVSWLAHVLAGTITDPVGRSWYDRYGLENSDKCQGTFGQTYTTANGARANINLGGMDFLIQQTWINAGKGYCGMRP